MVQKHRIFYDAFLLSSVQGNVTLPKNADELKAWEAAGDFVIFVYEREQHKGQIQVSSGNQVLVKAMKKTF